MVENTQGDAGAVPRAGGRPLRADGRRAATSAPSASTHFNGNLFDATRRWTLTADELKSCSPSAQLDWSNIDASIFGTLFERALDPDKRSQLGAHYTSREDIETIVEPVVMAPLRREWAAVREEFDALVAATSRVAKKWRDAERARSAAFLDRLASVTVLDPACGSGNFLYVTLQKLKDLEKEVIVHASRLLPRFFPQVGPVAAPRHRDEPLRPRARADDRLDRLPAVAQPTRDAA